MKYRFNVIMTDEDYLEYNKFQLIRSPYGKKQLRNLRISLTVLFGASVLLSLIVGGLSAEYLLTAVIPLAILYIIMQAVCKRFLAWSLKGQLKMMKKSGKPCYSPDSVMEFYEDCFTEITPDNKTEQKYSAIERISFVDGKVIYIHINNLLAYVLPLNCFESKEQYESFSEFIKTKCENVDTY